MVTTTHGDKHATSKQRQVRTPDPKPLTRTHILSLFGAEITVRTAFGAILSLTLRVQVLKI